MPERVKEKLVELLCKVQDYGTKNTCEECSVTVECKGNETVADHLIAHGVTVQDKTEISDEFLEQLKNTPVTILQEEPTIEVVQEWISVKDGLPKLIPCGAGTAYSEAVNVLTSGRKVLTAIWDGFDWTCDAEFWDAEDEEITHWTPVLLPLPQPPKEKQHKNFPNGDCK